MKAPSPADQTGEQSGNKLPNTATNVYNLGFLGIIILFTGLIIWIKRKV
ncbi:MULTISPECIES: LPXTG cell wall anchor domain-containing protein [Paenibacillus]